MPPAGDDALSFRVTGLNAPLAYLFVPGDAPKKLAKAAQAHAGAVIVDLEDSVACQRKSQALRNTAAFLPTQTPSAGAPEYWVRINAVDPAAALAELAALPLRHLTGIVHPKLSARAQLVCAGHWLDALEARDGIDPGRTAIIGIITETPGAIVGEAAATLAAGHARLRGYTWGIEDLAGALGRPPLPGATNANHDRARAIQHHCVLVAAAAGVEAIDGVSTVLRDDDALAAECAYARELGYTAKLAIHPAQVETIAATMPPSAEAIAWARRVRALVEDNPDAAAFELDGRMVDTPHFAVAARILARARTPGR